jgi:hypothetical protein
MDIWKKTGYNTSMSFTRTRRIIGILILLISLALLCWGIWPFGKLTQSIQLSPSDMQLPLPGSLVPERDGRIFIWYPLGPGASS